MGREGLRDEASKEVCNQIRSDGIHSHDDQRKRPLAVLPDVDHPTEAGKKQKADSAAEDGPTGRPDALHDRGDAGVVKRQTQGDSGRARNELTLFILYSEYH